MGRDSSLADGFAILPGIFGKEEIERLIGKTAGGLDLALRVWHLLTIRATSSAGILPRAMIVETSLTPP